ncbi:hypothetical protein NLU13_5697 [Sarocladium strictum]|uniref:EamA domain-containing protein n=1 Tax=Sarocladium strictum TaxID=5046 RepID=A0AA39GHD8_SARSR|nr:hypothetical protein NLU13_5697 [Sarocladium strictum]
MPSKPTQEGHRLLNQQRRQHPRDSLDSLDDGSTSWVQDSFTADSPHTPSSRTAGSPDPSSATNGHKSRNNVRFVAEPDMDPNVRRKGYLRASEGRSGTPLLSKPGEDDIEGMAGTDEGRGRSDGAEFHPLMTARPTFSRRSTMRSRSPKDEAAARATRKKYTYAAFFLVLSLISFCVQTELSAHIQHDLGWDKAYCMMYFTHGSWVVIWPVLLLCQRIQKWDQPWDVFWRKHKQQLLSTAMMVESRTLDVAKVSIHQYARPVRYVIRFTAIITSALTVAGLSWYIAVSLTTPSDLTAIYNCSAFFAYVFSVPILKEPLRLDKSIAVLIAIGGVLVVAYGDSGDNETDTTAGSRFIGNVIIGVGSVLYGLYEVMYKRYACPPDGAAPSRGMMFALTFGACIGFFTLTVLWIPLPILNFFNIEKFEIPEWSTCVLIMAATLSNATFSGSFLVLISLTSPVLSSVAALLTIFIVAIADWFITGEPLSGAAMLGGLMIIVAFLGLSWSTYREMQEHAAVQKVEVDLTDSDMDEEDREEEERMLGREFEPPSYRP